MPAHQHCGLFYPFDRALERDNVVYWKRTKGKINIDLQCNLIRLRNPGVPIVGVRVVSPFGSGVVISGVVYVQAIW